MPLDPIAPSDVRMNADQAVESLGALAHGHRLAIYRMLIEQGLAGLAAGMIATRLDMPPSSLTFHLQQLRHAGLIAQRRAGRQLIYAADFDRMAALVGFLTENCCGRGETFRPPPDGPSSRRASQIAPVDPSEPRIPGDRSPSAKKPARSPAAKTALGASGGRRSRRADQDGPV